MANYLRPCFRFFLSQCTDIYCCSYSCPIQDDSLTIEVVNQCDGKCRGVENILNLCKTNMAGKPSGVLVCHLTTAGSLLQHPAHVRWHLPLVLVLFGKHVTRLFFKKSSWGTDGESVGKKDNWVCGMLTGSL